MGQRIWSDEARWELLSRAINPYDSDDDDAEIDVSCRSWTVDGRPVTAREAEIIRTATVSDFAAVRDLRLAKWDAYVRLKADMRDRAGLSKEASTQEVMEAISPDDAKRLEAIFDDFFKPMVEQEFDRAVARREARGGR